MDNSQPTEDVREMFESDIERSKIRLLELVNINQSTVYLSDILGRASIDYAYKQYFEAEFGWWLYEEQTLRQTNPNLDLTDSGTQTILNSLDAQYRKHARFDREQLLTIIDSAVKSVLNYRVRPRTTLKWFVYRGEPTKPVYEVYLRMRYFADYRYLHEGFNQWLLKRGLRFDSLDIISVLEFERLIKKIDDDTILELSPSQFVDLISPIITFFADTSGDSSKNTIPIEALIVFLDDKEVYIIAQKLERMLYQQGIRHVTKDMFLAVVDEVLTEVEEESGELTTTSQAPDQGATDEAHGIEEGQPNDRQKPSATSVVLMSSPKAQREPIRDASAEHDKKSFATSQDDRDAVPTVDVSSSVASPSRAVTPPVEMPPVASSRESREEADPTKDSGLRAENASESKTTAPSFDPLLSPGSPTSVIEALSASTPRPAAPVPPEMDVETTVTTQSEADASTSLHQTKPDSTFQSTEIANVVTRGAFVSSSAPTTEGSLFTKNEQSDSETPVAPRELNTESESVRASRNPELTPEVVSKVSSSTAVESTSPASPEILGIISRALKSETPIAEPTLPSRSQYFENPSAATAAVDVEPMRTRVYPSLTSFYDDRQRESYIKKLCAKDENRFAGLVQSIDATSNWKEALAFLDKFYSQESIDPQSSVARDFRMAVYKRFIAI